MKKFLFIAALFIAQSACATTTIPVTFTTKKEALVLNLEVATTEPQRAQGLMNRKTLKPSDGMLFAFPSSSHLSFWMKNTLVPLDIIFVDADGKIIHIAREATPLSLAPIPSGGTYSTAIEIDGGRADREGIHEGNYAYYTLPKAIHVQ